MSPPQHHLPHCCSLDLSPAAPIPALSPYLGGRALLLTYSAPSAVAKCNVCCWSVTFQDISDMELPLTPFVSSTCSPAHFRGALLAPDSIKIMCQAYSTSASA